MSDFKPDSKVTIENLLRLKRAERPSPEFWSSFERELRQKQLTALLEKRPWWESVPRYFARRAYLPLGATAIIAFSLVSVRYYSPASLAQNDSRPATAAPFAGHRPEAAQTKAENVAVSSPLINRTAPVAVQAAEPVATVAAAAVRDASFSADLTGMQPTRESPSARSIAANLAKLEQSEPELMNLVLGGRLSSPARAQAASASDVELDSLANGTGKRPRLLARYNERPLNPEPTAPENVRERLARRLGDPDYTERFTQIGLKGVQVSLKF